MASALNAGSTGSYTLETLEPVDLRTVPTGDRMVVVGETVSGVLLTSGPVLTDGRPGQGWALRGLAGQRLIVDLVSSDFDAYLYLSARGSTRRWRTMTEERTGTHGSPPPSRRPARIG